MLLHEVPPGLLEACIAQGGDINHKEVSGWKNYLLLSFFAKYGHFQALRCLLEKGADASSVSPVDIVPFIEVPKLALLQELAYGSTRRAHRGALLAK